MVKLANDPGEDGDADDEQLPDDAEAQVACLMYIVTEHPTHITQDELVKAIVLDPASFRERDDVERAVRALYESGLVHLAGELLVPTRPALVFHLLSEQ